MNILLWVLQILLALWNIVGGMYIVHNYEKISNEWAMHALSGPAWIILGALQVLFAVGLLLPGEKSRRATSFSAACLAVLSLLGIALYTQYTGFPGSLWGVIPALLAAFVSYKRWDNPLLPKKAMS